MALEKSGAIFVYDQSTSLRYITSMKHSGVLFDNEYFEDSAHEDDRDEISRPAKSRKLGLIALFGLMLTVGISYAANVNLGNQSGIEFGQGVLLTGACDSNISASPTTSFKNDSSTAGFVFAGIKLSGISNACQNKLFILTAWPETSTSLNINSDIPHKSLKFHFDNSGPIADMAGCLSFPSYSVNSADDNRIYASTSNCQWPDPNFDQHNVFSNNVYKFTLETRENTIKRILLKYTKGDARTVGWVFDTGEEIHLSQFNAMTEYPAYLDSLKNSYFSIYLKLDNVEFASASTVASTFNFTSTNGTTCTYAGTVQNGTRSRAPGLGAWWSQFQGIEWVCQFTQNDTLTIS
jgi:hypothetical protein